MLRQLNSQKALPSERAATYHASNWNFGREETTATFGGYASD